MKFKLRNGPWKMIFEGNFQGHEMEISMNPEQVMLVAIYEKEGQETVGVILQSFAVFSAVGEAETFIESIQKEAIILSRHDGKRTVQFIAIASNQIYVKAEEEKVLKSVDDLLAEVSGSGNKIESVAKSFDLHLTALRKCSSAIKQSFFSQPFIIPMLAKEAKRIEIEKEEAQVESGVEGAAVILGTSKAGKQIKEPLQMFQRTMVSDGTLPQREDFIRIITESFLLANTPVLIFDEHSSFLGLAHPAKNSSELQSHGIQIDPMGFPTKEFKVAKSIKINVNDISPGGFMQLFGWSDEEAEKIIVKGLKKGNVEGLEQLSDNIELLEIENPFLKKRIERVLNLIATLYPQMFDGDNNIEEIVERKFQKIGSASIVSMEKIDPRALTLLLESLSTEVINFFSKKGEAKTTRLLVVIPRIERVFMIKENLALKEFIRMLTEMKRFGISFVIGTDKRSDLSKEILQLCETKTSIIKENDVAIDFPNSKNYRILVRPSLSRGKEE